MNVNARKENRIGKCVFSASEKGEKETIREIEREGERERSSSLNQVV